MSDSRRWSSPWGSLSPELSSWSCRALWELPSTRRTQWLRQWNPPWPRWCFHPSGPRRSHEAWSGQSTHVTLTALQPKVNIWRIQTLQKLFNPPQQSKTTQDSLGVSLLQQGAPELVPLSGLSEDQLVVEGWDAVVNDDVHPVAITPELKDRRR